MSNATAQPSAPPAPPPITPIIANWVHLPIRNIAINLKRVTRVEFGADDYAVIYFDHAECDDEDNPGFTTTAQLPIMGDDTAAIRWALAMPPYATDGAR